ncbi:hypothetical protein [Microbacterium foliorum]|uniref:hypothetical protein n=1 Tax=Microbacterium foliorum TaxID=104336 RepID=UPI001DDC5FCC|nr:hypothetical protein [Microbacterium foliorum]CAH0237548.1 hypothetical protein SRABI03_02879 [Microbacterium foliorum]
MIEQPVDKNDLPTQEEVIRETEHFLERDVIHYHRISDTAYGISWMLYPVNSPQRREVAESLARYFHRETHLDFPPYTAGDENDDRLVYLVRSMRITTAVPIIAGAVGLQRASEEWVLTWIWLHPWERRTRLVDAVFDLLDAAFGDFFIEAPISGAMRGLMTKRHYESSRLVTRA